MNDEDVLAQADSLMRRHRSFVARQAESAAPPAPVSAPAAEIPDVPVLTDIVADDRSPLSAEQLRLALESRLADWIDAILPQRVDQLADQLRAHLLAGLTEEARASLLPTLLDALDAAPLSTSPTLPLTDSR